MNIKFITTAQWGCWWSIVNEKESGSDGRTL